LNIGGAGREEFAGKAVDGDVDETLLEAEVGGMGNEAGKAGREGAFAPPGAVFVTGFVGKLAGIAAPEGGAFEKDGLGGRCAGEDAALVFPGVADGGGV